MDILVEGRLTLFPLIGVPPPSVALSTPEKAQSLVVAREERHFDDAHGATAERGGRPEAYPPPLV